MKLFRRILIFYIFHQPTFVTGEELLLLTAEDKIYRYNTKNNQENTIAENAIHMACDFERKRLYYTQLSVVNQNFVKIFRVDYDGGNVKTISDTADLSTGHIRVDQETGNIYYYSSKGIGFYSYTRNYSRTAISNSALPYGRVYDIGFHGTGSNKRVYVSTEVDLYRLQPGTSDLINLETECRLFAILDNGMVCYQLLSGGFHLADLNGVKTESLPNISITSSILNDSRCPEEGYIWSLTAIDDNLYLLCLSPNQVLKVDLKTGVKKVLIPESSPILTKRTLIDICVLSREKVAVTDQKVVSSTRTATILMVVGGVVIGLVIIVILIVAIRTCKKTTPDGMPRIYDNHRVNQPGEPEYSGYNSNSPNEDQVYTTPDSSTSTELDTIDDPVYTEIL